MPIVTVENFELVIDGLDALLFMSVDIPPYKTDVQGGDVQMSGKRGGVRQTLTKKREQSAQITLKTLASGDQKSTSSKMRTWLNECMPKSENGKGFPDSARKKGSIDAYNSEGTKISSWRLDNAWICKYTIDSLTIDGGLMEETFTLQVDQFERAS